MRWRRANLGGLDLDSYTIEDNTIQVNNTNENVDLRASGTGTVGFEEIRANNNTLSVRMQTILNLQTMLLLSQQIILN